MKPAKKIRPLHLALFIFSLFPIGIAAIFFYRTYEVLVWKEPLNLPTPPKERQTPSIPEKKPCVTGGKVYTMMYHYVREPDPRDSKIVANLSVPVEHFRRQMKMARELADKWTIALASLKDLEDMKTNKCYTHKNIFIFTADDGWSDSYDVLAPIANEYKIPFAFSIISWKLDVPGFITTSELRELVKNPLFTITAHSLNHFDQSKLSPEQEENEMCLSKKTLESLIGKPINTFIYPAWRMSEASWRIAKKCGYTFAFSTNFWTSYEKGVDYYHINRYRINNDTLETHFEYLISLSKKMQASTGAILTETGEIDWNNYLKNQK